MKGSEKQIKWAEDIKAGKADEFAKFHRMTDKNPIGSKAIDYIESNEWASFWISNRDRTVESMLTSLCRGGLRIKGDEYDHKAIIDMQTGTITVTWSEIVSDGKGGHKATRTQTL